MSVLINTFQFSKSLDFREKALCVSQLPAVNSFIEFIERISALDRNSQTGAAPLVT